MSVDEAVAGSGLNAVKALKAEQENDTAVSKKPAITGIAPPGGPIRSIAPPGGPPLPSIRSVAPPGGPEQPVIRSLAPPGGPSKPDVKPVAPAGKPTGGASGDPSDPAPWHAEEEAAAKSVAADGARKEEAAAKSVAADCAGKDGALSVREIKQKAKELFVQSFNSGELQGILARTNASAETANGLTSFNLEDSSGTTKNAEDSSGTTKSAEDASAHGESSCNFEEIKEETSGSAAAQSQDADQGTAVHSPKVSSGLEEMMGNRDSEPLANAPARAADANDKPRIQSIAPPGGPPKPVIRSIAPPGGPPKPDIKAVAPPAGQVNAAPTQEAAAIAA